MKNTSSPFYSIETLIEIQATVNELAKTKNKIKIAFSDLVSIKHSKQRHLVSFFEKKNTSLTQSTYPELIPGCIN